MGPPLAHKPTPMLSTTVIVVAHTERCVYDKSYITLLSISICLLMEKVMDIFIYRR